MNRPNRATIARAKLHEAAASHQKMCAVELGQRADEAAVLVRDCLTALLISAGQALQIIEAPLFVDTVKKEWPADEALFWDEMRELSFSDLKLRRMSGLSFMLSLRSQHVRVVVGTRRYLGLVKRVIERFEESGADEVG